MRESASTWKGSAQVVESGETRGRGRPKTFDRERVIQIAMNAYWSEGTDDVSLNEICRRAGVSKPAIYREFGGEDGLMDAALEFYATTVLAPVMGYITQDGPFAEVLFGLVDLMVGVGADVDRNLPAGCLLAKMRVLSSRLGPATQARVDALRADALASYAAWVERAKGRGEVSADISTAVAASFLDTQLTSLFMQIALGDDPEALRAQSRLTFAGLTASS